MATKHASATPVSSGCKLQLQVLLVLTPHVAAAHSDTYRPLEQELS